MVLVCVRDVGSGPLIAVLIAPQYGGRLSMKAAPLETCRPEKLARLSNTRESPVQGMLLPVHRTVSNLVSTLVVTLVVTLVSTRYCECYIWFMALHLPCFPLRVVTSVVTAMS